MPEGVSVSVSSDLAQTAHLSDEACREVQIHISFGQRFDGARYYRSLVVWCHGPKGHRSSASRMDKKALAFHDCTGTSAVRETNPTLDQFPSPHTPVGQMPRAERAGGPKLSASFDC